MGSRRQTKPSQPYNNRNFAKKCYTKCEPFGAVDSPNLHIYVLNEIFIKKVRHRKCDPLSSVDRPNLHNYYKYKFCSKKCNAGSVTLWVQFRDQTFTTVINKNFAKKVRCRKCDLLGPVDNRYNFISINRNFAQKSAT